MENSRTYRYLINQITASGRQKLDGYYSNIMEEIYDWERDEVEDIIWNTFHKNSDTDLSGLMPKLKKYDGITALKESLLKCNIPSGNSLNIAKVLYEQTNETSYLDIFKQNMKDSSNISPIVAMLSYIKPSDALYKMLTEIYISENDEIARNNAVLGILYHKKYIENPHSIQERMELIDIRRQFNKEDMDERRSMIASLENGEFMV